LYSNLSPKVHVKYVDADKENMLAREAGIKNYGTAIVQIGANKQEAKGLNEEGITGAFIRDLRTPPAPFALSPAAVSTRSTIPAATAFPNSRNCWARMNTSRNPLTSCKKAEFPATAPFSWWQALAGDYQQPEVDAIKKFVEDGGRALFMLDPPLKVGRSEIADNDALTGVLKNWGVTLDKDLILDMNPIGQLAGLGPQVALVTSYDSHPIVSEMKGTATGFPLSRSMDVKNGDKTTVQKLFWFFGVQPGHRKAEFAGS